MAVLAGGVALFSLMILVILNVVGSVRAGGVGVAFAGAAAGVFAGAGVLVFSGAEV
jgi:hypothetical protein